MAGNTIELNNYGLQETKSTLKVNNTLLKKNNHHSGKKSEVILKKKSSLDNPLRLFKLRQDQT